MTKQLSFSKFENEIMPDFRDRINRAESDEDVKKFFAYAANELMNNVFAGKIPLQYGDISLDPTAEAPQFKVTERLLDLKEFSEIWHNSDMRHVTGRLAQTAANRCKHLGKHPEKTNAKIRM
ncbi:MAG TPA: hypothetical protein VLL73_00415 [Desulfurivibrionaceae bacterium]|nr:hypothetical protein [Desulfurivibrionaceae bacterium]